MDEVGFETTANTRDILRELACTHDALRRAARQLGNLYDDTVAPTGLKATQIGMLGQIERLATDQGPSLQAVADVLAIGVSALTHALRPLIRDGLVQLRPDDHDRRMKHAILTDLGKRRFEEGLRLWTIAHRRTEAILGAESAELLRSLAGQVSSKDFMTAHESHVIVAQRDEAVKP